ncbi:MAG TPA: hypothetical protein DEA22_12130 [Blastocatellia bacterium]|nr:hypothetical protein [Blastocatellia bacterium]
MRIFLLFLVVFLTCPLGAQSDGSVSFRQANQELNSLYKSGNFEAALKHAEKLIEASVKEFGPESYEAANAYRDAGIVLKKLNRYKGSVDKFQKAIEILLKIPSEKGYDLIDTYQHLGTSQMFAERYKDAKASYEKALEIAEARNGVGSKESFNPTLNLANFFARIKKIELAQQYYLTSYELAHKHFASDLSQTFLIQDSVVCLFDAVTNEKQRKAFDEEYEKRWARVKSNNLGSVINGKALSLPKPAYPRGAVSRIAGRVAVRVTIDEEGYVIEARAVCGAPILAEASIKAAFQARFSPTFLNNKPLKVIGIISYNFLP